MKMDLVTASLNLLAGVLWLLSGNAPAGFCFLTVGFLWLMSASLKRHES